MAQIDDLVRATSATEVIVTTMIHDHRERVRSYELLAGVRDPGSGIRIPGDSSNRQLSQPPD